MIYWCTFHFTILFLCVLFANTKRILYRAVIASAICCILIYFSGFRDGLGEDYNRYIQRLEWLASSDFVSFSSEPLFNLIGFIVNKTSLSEVLLPFICACVTNIGIVLFCFTEKKYFPWMILLYVFIPVLYTQSFNLMRQYFAIGLFYYSLRYVGKSLWKYQLLLFVAGMMHFSALLLMPLYWVLNKKLKKIWIIPIALLFLVLIPVSNTIAGLSERYRDTASYLDTTMAFSGFTLVYNAVLLVILFFRGLYDKMNPICLNLMLLLVAFIDLSYIYYGYYRFSIYFIPIIIYAIPFIFHQLRISSLKVFIIAILILIDYNYLLKNTDNTIVVPKNILEISKLFD